MVLAALVAARTLPRWLGKPAAVLLLDFSWPASFARPARSRSSPRGRRPRTHALERLAAAWRDPDPDRPAVVLGVPTGRGHAMISSPTSISRSPRSIRARRAARARTRVHRLPRGAEPRDPRGHLAARAGTSSAPRPAAARLRGRRPDRAQDVDGFVRALLAATRSSSSRPPNLAVTRRGERPSRGPARGWTTR